MADGETYFDDGRECYKATGNPVWPSRHRESPSLKPGDEEHKGLVTKFGARECAHNVLKLRRCE
jgi:hypothetical protein